MNDLTDVELQTCGAQTEQERANLVHSLQKWKNSLPHHHHQAYKTAWYNTSILQRKGGEEERRRHAARWLRLPHLGGGGVWIPRSDIKDLCFDTPLLRLETHKGWSA
jgi:hypothetical protein